MNLKDWAKRQGVSYTTARRWFKSGRLPLPSHRIGGLILVGELAPPERDGLTVIYAQVATVPESGDLDRQVSRIAEWCGQHGIPVHRVVREFGTGVRGSRRDLLALLRDPNTTTIVMEDGTSIEGLGYQYVAAAMVAAGRHLLLVDRYG